MRQCVQQHSTAHLTNNNDHLHQTNTHPQVRIDTSPSAAATILVEAFAKRFEGTLAPLPGARSPNTLALDFSRVQLLGGRGANGAATHAATLKATATTPMLAPGELKLVNAILRPGARLHLISVAASHLALRFTPAATTATTATVGAHTAAQEQELGAGAAASSLLVFERTAAAPPKRPAAAASASAAAGAKKGVAARAAAAVKKAVAAVGDGKKQPQQPQAPKPRFKKPLKGTPSNPYASFFEYLEEECVPLYLVLAFPTFMKHVGDVILDLVDAVDDGPSPTILRPTNQSTPRNPPTHPQQMPHIAHAARFKLLLLQELWVELSARLPFLPHH